MLSILYFSGRGGDFQERGGLDFSVGMALTIIETMLIMCAL